MIIMKFYYYIALCFLVIPFCVFSSEKLDNHNQILGNPIFGYVQPLQKDNLVQAIPNVNQKRSSKTSVMGIILGETNFVSLKKFHENYEEIELKVLSDVLNIYSLKNSEYKNIKPSNNYISSFQLSKIITDKKGVILGVDLVKLNRQNIAKDKEFTGYNALLTLESRYGPPQGLIFSFRSVPNIDNKLKRNYLDGKYWWLSDEDSIWLSNKYPFMVPVFSFMNSNDNITLCCDLTDNSCSQFSVIYRSLDVLKYIFLSNKF